MLIRSQDKTAIINFENTNGIFTEVKKLRDKGIKEHYETDIMYHSGTAGGRIGTYSSEEKAIKVLDMIEQEYKIELYKNKVFQMPQDSEVLA